MQFLAVALGGAIGAMGRYWLVELVNQLCGKTFPWATFIVNILGAFVIGVFYVLIIEKAMVPEAFKPLVVTGFLGAFTTFSAFSLDLFHLLEQGHIQSALLYSIGSVVVCLLATFLSITLSRNLI